jgi:hypothetical protein
MKQTKKLMHLFLNYETNKEKRLHLFLNYETNKKSECIRSSIIDVLTLLPWRAGLVQIRSFSVNSLMNGFARNFFNKIDVQTSYLGDTSVNNHQPLGKP